MLVAAGTSVASCVLFAAGTSAASQLWIILKFPMTWAFFLLLAHRRRRFFVVTQLMSSCSLVPLVVSSDEVPVDATSFLTLMLAAMSLSELAAMPLSEMFPDVSFELGFPKSLRPP